MVHRCTSNSPAVGIWQSTQVILDEKLFYIIEEFREYINKFSETFLSQISGKIRQGQGSLEESCLAYISSRAIFKAVL
jgi:hypothetical protein